MDINNAMYIKIKFLNNQNYYFEGAITFIKFNVFVQKKITSYNNIVGNQILNYFKRARLWRLLKIVVSTSY